MLKAKVKPAQGEMSFRAHSPTPTIWYIEPIGELCNRVLAEKLPADSYGDIVVTRAKGKTQTIPAWTVTHKEVEYFVESRKTDERLRFSVWYKSKVTEEILLDESDYSFAHRNRALKKLRRGRRGLPYVRGVVTADKMQLPGRPAPRVDPVTNV